MGMSGSMSSPLITNTSSAVLSKPPMSSVESIAVSTGSMGSLMSSAQFMGSPTGRHSDSFSSLKSIAAQAVATANLRSQVQIPTDYSAENRGRSNNF